ncbi:MAG TPA: DegT/DnrJ/EryC1/StrS family aminotransferase [Bacteroidales bacterium]|nr:DegT/DnrJ/EryC1/StrS family aminotransferase [Bacteroidales bacterium]
MKRSGFIPLMIPDIQQQDIDAVVEVLKTGLLVQGQKVEELEKNIAGYLGVKHAVAASSGTATLHIALLASGIGTGDEVIVPAFSFMATANVIELTGARPVFVDIDIKTLNIDVSKIEEAITRKTRAIMPVHEFGMACNITEICEIASKYNLIVIEDAACALGAKENGKYAGSFGEIASFSFHPRKAITSGEGGMLVTNNDKLAEKFRILRNHGISFSNEKTEFVEAGFNYRMTDFQAAFVNSQFQRFEQILGYRNMLADIYFEQLKNVPAIQLPFLPDKKNHTWQSYHILVPANRDQIIKKLKAENIVTNLGAQCMPFQEYFQKKYRLDCQKLFPNAMKAYNQGLVLPLYNQLDAEDLKRVSEKLIKILGNENL